MNSDSKTFNETIKKRVPEDLRKTLMDCEYQLSLSVGNAEEYSGDLESYGLKWPK